MALDWLPIAPALLAWKKLLDAQFGPPMAAQSLPQSQVIARLWSESQPRFPVQHLRRPWRPAGLHVVPFVVPSATVPPLAWHAVYPDWVARRRPLLDQRPTVFTVPRTAPPDVQWLGSYPAWIARRRLPVADIPTVFHVIVPAPPLRSWAPTYPDRALGKIGLRTAAQQPYAFYPRPVPAPDPPGLGYRTTVYPDRIDPRRGLGAIQQRALVTIVEPIPNPPIPTAFTWAPLQPQLPLRSIPRVQAAGMIGPAALFEASGVAAPIRWTPTYPDRLPPPPRPSSLLTTAVRVDLSAPVIILPSQQGWGAVYPDWLGTRAQIAHQPPADPEPVFHVAVVPTVATCLRLTHEQGGPPTLATTATGVSRLAEEIVTPPILSAEEEC